MTRKFTGKCHDAWNLTGECHGDLPVHRNPTGGMDICDQLVAETSTWQHTTLTTDKYPCPRWDSNPRSQQASGRISSLRVKDLTLILLTWRKWWAPNNASKQQMGFNSAFKGLISVPLAVIWTISNIAVEWKLRKERFLVRGSLQETTNALVKAASRMTMSNLNV